LYFQILIYRGDNEPDGIENATHNIFTKQTWIYTRTISRFTGANVFWVAFSIPLGPL
jgi:hypothetical protein